MRNVESMPLGVIVERRRSSHPWQDHVWLPVEVLPGAAALEAWSPLAEGPDWTRYHAATLALELFPKEAEAYGVNLTSDRPVVYVILRPREEAEGPEVEAFLVTASADEVQEYLDAGSDIVEGVAMPPVVRAWIEDFVARHHKSEPFEKRARKRWRDGAEAKGGPPGRGRPGRGAAGGKP